eukprot:Platyproteum_vivax@DN4328_c0_g1_i1.p1
MTQVSDLGKWKRGIIELDDKTQYTGEIFVEDVIDITQVMNLEIALFFEDNFQTKLKKCLSNESTQSETAIVAQVLREPQRATRGYKIEQEAINDLKDPRVKITENTTVTDKCTLHTGNKGQRQRFLLEDEHNKGSAEAQRVIELFKRELLLDQDNNKGGGTSSMIPELVSVPRKPEFRHFEPGPAYKKKEESNLDPEPFRPPGPRDYDEIIPEPITFVEKAKDRFSNFKSHINKGHGFKLGGDKNDNKPKPGAGAGPGASGEQVPVAYKKHPDFHLSYDKAGLLDDSELMDNSDPPDQGTGIYPDLAPLGLQEKRRDNSDPPRRGTGIYPDLSPFSQEKTTNGNGTPQTGAVFDPQWGGKPGSSSGSASTPNDPRNTAATNLNKDLLKHLDPPIVPKSGSVGHGTRPKQAKPLFVFPKTPQNNPEDDLPDEPTIKAEIRKKDKKRKHHKSAGKYQLLEH